MKRSARIGSANFGFLLENGDHPANSTGDTEDRCSGSRAIPGPRMPAAPKWIARMGSLLLIIPLVASVAHAQYVNVPTGRQFNNIHAANAEFVISQIVNDRLLQTRMAALAQAQPDAATKNVPPPAQAKYRFALSATDFKSEGKRDAPEQLAVNAGTPGQRVQLTQMYRQIQQAVEASPDVRKNNLATAVTILLGSSIQVVAQKAIGDAEAVDLLRLINDIIAGTPDFNKIPNQQRTAAYDAFLINGGLIAGIDANAKETNDHALAALARELALSSLAQFGFKAPIAEPSPQAALVSNPVSGSAPSATPPATKKSNSNGMLDGIYSGLSSALRFSAGGGLTADPPGST